MPTRPVVLVAETPSLASALSGLFESEGLAVRTVPDAAAAASLCGAGEFETALVVAASNAYGSETVGRWLDQPFSRGSLLVVGTRSPELRSRANLHVLHLPVRFEELLRLVRNLVDLPATETGRAPLPGRPMPV